MSNKDICNMIFADAIDRARQKVWEQVQVGQLDKKKAENILINMDKALAYSQQYLHDQISGKDAKFIANVRPESRTVLMGHQAQAVYFSVGWDSIHEINDQILELEKKNPGGNKNVPRMLDVPPSDVAKDVRRLQLEHLRLKGLISEPDYRRYRKEMGIDDEDIKDAMTENFGNEQDPKTG